MYSLLKDLNIPNSWFPPGLPREKLDRISDQIFQRAIENGYVDKMDYNLEEKEFEISWYFFQSMNAMDDFLDKIDINDLRLKEFGEINGGYHPCKELAVIYGVEKLDWNIFQHPKWIKMNEHISKICVLCNDIISYESEVLTKSHQSNSLYFLQNKGKTFEESYQFLLKLINLEIKDIWYYKESLLEVYSKIIGPDEMKELENIVQSVLSMIGGSIMWSLQCKRYSSNDSIFKELKLDKEEGNINSSSSTPIIGDIYV
eukprot:gene2583-3200_t